MFRHILIQTRNYINRSDSDFIKLTLYTKKNCSLCDQAKEIIDDLYPETFEIEEIDITKNKELFNKFKFDIPVFYYKDTFLMQHKVDKTALEKLIKQVENFKN